MSDEPSAGRQLYEYVCMHAERGQCRCGSCIDGGTAQPCEIEGEPRANVIFFEVVPLNAPDPRDFDALARAALPGVFDGKEHSYLEVGGLLGDQGFALVTMGLGSILGTWELLTPETMMPFLPAEMKMEMAGRGMITIRVAGDSLTTDEMREKLAAGHARLQTLH